MDSDLGIQGRLCGTLELFNSLTRQILSYWDKGGRGEAQAKNATQKKPIRVFEAK